MKVLVIGQGGREHAIVRALSLSPSVKEVHALPGSHGMASEAICHAQPLSDPKALNALIKTQGIDLVVIGPEAPLADGLADKIREMGVEVFGPSQAAARLEASKIFAKEFMVSAGVATSEYQVVTSVEQTLKASAKFTPPYVLKADGLAAGKGVVICKDQEELKAAATRFFEEKVFGASGEKALLEQHIDGWELSFLVVTNGKGYRSFPFSQDHKRLLDGDQGPNTGGMGVVAPVTIDSELEHQIHDRIVKPTIQHLENQSLDYRGVIFFGIMVGKQGPMALEYNVRFGDPECQVLLPLLDGDWGAVMASVAQGRLPELKWKPQCATCVVLAAENYPQNPVKGALIQGNIDFKTDKSYFLHAGTERTVTGQWQTAGGRVLNAIGLGSTLKESIENAYAQARQVNWNGLQMRKDIGARQL